MIRRRCASLAAAGLLVLAAAVPAHAQSGQTPLAQALNALPLRNIGPFRSSAWVTSIAVPDALPAIHAIALAQVHAPYAQWIEANVSPE